MKNENIIDVYLRVRVNIDDDTLIDLKTGKRKASDFIFSSEFPQGIITGVTYKIIKNIEELKNEK